jgi:excisionase family DNA binding protein
VQPNDGDHKAPSLAVIAGKGRRKAAERQQNSAVKRLFTISEAAVYLGRSEWSVRRLIWDGQLATVRAGRRVHVDLRDMEAFIDKHKEVAA